jgi:hypothetical protein
LGLRVMTLAAFGGERVGLGYDAEAEVVVVTVFLDVAWSGRWIDHDGCIWKSRSELNVETKSIVTKYRLFAITHTFLVVNPFSRIANSFWQAIAGRGH